MYIRNLFRELRIWAEVRRTARENVGRLNEIGFDVDWVGRIYTIIEVPDELNDLPHRNVNETIERNVAIDLYVKNQLSAITALLNDLRLSDLVMYPDSYDQFEGTNSILLVLAPERRYFTLFKVTAFLLSVVAAVVGAVVGVSYLVTR